MVVTRHDGWQGMPRQRVLFFTLSTAALPGPMQISKRPQRWAFFAPRTKIRRSVPAEASGVGGTVDP